MISLIVAIAKNNVIGINNTLPWHIKEDFLHFKNYTTGKTILMGDKTFLSIGKPLPNRKTIVVSLDDFKYDDENVSIRHDLYEVFNEYKKKDEELVVCGGATIYKLSLPYVDKLVISRIKKEYEGDTYFPSIPGDFKLVSSEDKGEFDIEIYTR